MADDPLEQTEEYSYFINKRTDRTYISKQFQSADIFGIEKPRPMRILSKVIDSEEPYEFVQVKKEVVLRLTPSKRQEVKVIFYDDTREVKHITIQRFTVEGGKPHKHSFTFSGKEIETLYNIIKLVRYVDLEDRDKFRLDDNMMNQWLISEDEKQNYLIENLDLVQEIIEHHITKSDVIAFAYRKNQLNEFYSMLHNQEYFDSKKEQLSSRGDEAVWQKFFEQNPWIFGYGLNYIFKSQLDNKKLEQITTGFNFNEAGKRTDALMKTQGLISSLCFVEIKTHKTPLLKKVAYRDECWPISDDLCGSVAQIQKTVQKAIKTIQSKIVIASDDGNPTGEKAFLYQPKSFVVIGCLDEFISPNGINEQKYGSFELFRRNCSNPEIITFDELYARAKFIVKLSEEENRIINDPTEDSIYEDDVPF
jgi:hypothetical protein